MRRIRGRERGQSLVEFALLAPIMLFLLFAMLDLARIFTAMTSVESAAREAADYATSLGAERWSATNKDFTIAEMKRRACVAASDLHDYAGVDTAPADGIDEDCSNPSFEWCMTASSGGPCVTDYPISADGDPDPCDDPNRGIGPTSAIGPCTVTVTLSHTFHLFVPLQFDFFGVKLGLPVTLPFERDSTFAMTDIDVTSSPGP